MKIDIRARLHSIHHLEIDDGVLENAIVLIGETPADAEAFAPLLDAAGPVSLRVAVTKPQAGKAEAGSRLWDVAVLCGRLDALGHLGELGSAVLRQARHDAAEAGCTQHYVDHATVRGLEWGRSDVPAADEICVRDCAREQLC